MNKFQGYVTWWLEPLHGYQSPYSESWIACKTPPHEMFLVDVEHCIEYWLSDSWECYFELTASLPSRRYLQLPSPMVWIWRLDHISIGWWLLLLEKWHVGGWSTGHLASFSAKILWICEVLYFLVSKWRILIFGLANVFFVFLSSASCWLHFRKPWIPTSTRFSETGRTSTLKHCARKSILVVKVVWRASWMTLSMSKKASHWLPALPI